MKNDTLKTIVDRRLSAMDWTGQDAVLRALHTSGAPRPQQRRLRLALVMALITLLLLGTALALGLAFGRMGCLLNGCCFGAPSDLPWCHTWPAHSIPYGHYLAQGFKVMPPIHPAQVYAIVNALLLLAVLHLAGRWKRRHGVLLGAFFGLYGLSRFLLEMIRAGEPTTSLGGLTVWQVTSLAIAAAAGVYLLILPKLPMSDLLWNPPLRNGPSATKKPRP